MQTLILSIIIFGIIIFVHEFGHYSVAKITGVKVEEFALGMGPKLIGKQWGETYYSFRVFPLGGFCRMAGENTGESLEQKNTSQVDISKRFDKKPLHVRFAVIAAGSIMNLLLAVLIFSSVFAIIGIPSQLSNEIGSVLPGTPAESAGLLPGDKIIRINGTVIEDWSGVTGYIHNNPGEELTIELERAEDKMVFKITPEFNSDTQTGMIGITSTNSNMVKVGVLNSIRFGTLKTVEIIQLTFQSIGQMITGKVSAEGISGPVGIIKIIGETANYGLLYVANLTALISINIGLRYLFPIPALDGSRLLFLFAELIRGKPVPAAKENMIHFLGFVFLMSIMLFVTYKDIIKLF